jgi:hypothetical protein
LREDAVSVATAIAAQAVTSSATVTAAMLEAAERSMTASMAAALSIFTVTGMDPSLSTPEKSKGPTPDSTLAAEGTLPFGLFTITRPATGMNSYLVVESAFRAMSFSFQKRSLT